MGIRWAFHGNDMSISWTIHVCFIGTMWAIMADKLKFIGSLLFVEQPWRDLAIVFKYSQDSHCSYANVRGKRVKQFKENSAS